MKKYNHLFEIAFSVISDSEDPNEVTAEELLDGLCRRYRALLCNADEIMESCENCNDTYEMEV